ncbi:MAG: hypothetical protein ACRC1U_02360 [Vibrionaceae bacterium]
MINNEFSSSFLQDGLLTEEKAVALMQGRCEAVRADSLQQLVVKLVKNKEYWPILQELKEFLNSAVAADIGNKTKAKLVLQAVLGYENLAQKTAFSGAKNLADAPPQPAQTQHVAKSPTVVSCRKEILKPIFPEGAFPTQSQDSSLSSQRALLIVAQQLEAQAAAEPSLSLDTASRKTQALIMHLHGVLTSEFQSSLFVRGAQYRMDAMLLKLFVPEIEESNGDLQAQAQAPSEAPLSKLQLLKLLVITLRGYGAALPEAQRTALHDELDLILQQDVHVNGVGTLERLSFATLLFGTQAERERACREVMQITNSGQELSRAAVMLKVKRSVAQLLQLFLQSFTPIITK